jgi:putative toxin-antitoxin system antitoxin component (TIGR02293 family)
MVYNETIGKERFMAHAQPTLPGPEADRESSRKESAHRPARTRRRRKNFGSVSDLVSLSVEARKGISKASAAHLFGRIAAGSPFPAGKLRAELIPDSTWKRARKTLGPQASQTVARLEHVLSFAERVWGNQADAIEWLTRSHMELRGATPFSQLRTEAGGRAVEWILAALEYGFPV